MSNITFTNLPPAISLSGAEIIAGVQNGTSVRMTINQISTLIGLNAAGLNTQVQYNLSGRLAGSPNFTFDGSRLIVPSVLAVNGIYGGSF